MSELRERLESDLGEVEWERIKPHLERDAIIIVDESLGLVDVAEAVCSDDSAKVSQWIGSGKLLKPTPEQVELWNAEPKKLFSLLIAKPFVLMQEPRQ